jgi:hypothetical protein
MSPHCEQRGLAYTQRGGALAATRLILTFGDAGRGW